MEHVYFLAGWSAAMKRFGRYRRTAHFSVNHFDFASQRVGKISDLPGLFTQWGPSVSADGHTFLISGIERVEGDIVLVDGFR